MFDSHVQIRYISKYSVAHRFIIYFLCISAHFMALLLTYNSLIQILKFLGLVFMHLECLSYFCLFTLLLLNVFFIWELMVDCPITSAQCLIRTSSSWQKITFKSLNWVYNWCQIGYISHHICLWYWIFLDGHPSNPFMYFTNEGGQDKGV